METGKLSFGKKKLGFGLMRLPLLDPENNAAVDVEQLKVMVDRFMEKGFTYFDTAWMYCGFQSENAIREALVERYPRDSFTLTTKLHVRFVTCKEDRDKIFNEQLRKTGAKYFDYYLLHNASTDNYGDLEKYDCFEWLKEKKRQGLVKHIGFSIHDGPDGVERMLREHPEMEFVQLQLNYLDWDSVGIRSRECYEIAEKYHKPVIVMEPVKGGALFNLPPEALALMRSVRPDDSPAAWALRFAADKPNVQLVLSGMSSIAQMEDNLAIMEEPQSLSEEESAVLDKVVKILGGDRSVPCTSCSYCTDGCPMGIPIPRYFALFNADHGVYHTKGWSPQLRVFQAMSKLPGNTAECIACGQCESICPQHISIIEELKKLTDYFTKPVTYT